MPLRSLRPGGSCPDTGVCPTSCRPHGAVWLLPASVPTCHLETLPPLAFSVVLHAEYAPEDCSFAETASARVGKHSRTVFLRSRFAPVPRHSPVSFLSVSPPLVLPSGGQQLGLPARDWPSASRPLLSPCSSAPPSTRCDKNAPCTAATGLPDRTPPDFPLTPNSCRKQIAGCPSARVLSNAAEMLSSWPYLPSTLPRPLILPEIPLRSPQSPPGSI